MRFLLVEDSDDIGDAVSARLSEQGHAIDWVTTLADADAVLAASDVDLIVLDIMLPDGDGRDFLAQHRAREKDTPVIVLTARSQVSDRISMLDLGADDYVTKPFEHAELEARSRAVLRRKVGSVQTVTRLGNVEFDPVAGSLLVSGNTVTLRNRELRLLEVLINSPGQIFSKQNLVDRLFSYDNDVSENAIEVYIGRLRKHLTNSNLNIITIRGMGYRLDNGD